MISASVDCVLEKCPHHFLRPKINNLAFVYVSASDTESYFSFARLSVFVFCCCACSSVSLDVWRCSITFAPVTELDESPLKATWSAPLLVPGRPWSRCCADDFTQLHFNQGKHVRGHNRELLLIGIIPSTETSCNPSQDQGTIPTCSMKAYAGHAVEYSLVLATGPRLWNLKHA